jgi:hypothetical protein
VKALLFALPLLVALPGCVSPWPANMPPVSYSGTIFNEPRNRPEPDAKVMAFRPGMKLGLFSEWLDSHWLMQAASARDRIIGETRSSSGGHFVIMTSGGYATQFMVLSRDEWLEGWTSVKSKKGATNLILKIRPEVQALYCSLNLSDEQSDILRSAFNKMAFQYASTRYRKSLSIDDYFRSGILSPREFQLLLQLKPHLLGPHLGIQAGFSRHVLRIDSFAEPVRFIFDSREPTPYCPD